MQRSVLIPVLVIFFGVLLLLKNVFNWNISIFKIFVGVAVIAIGISLLTGGFSWFRSGFGGYSGHSSFSGGTPAGQAENVSFGERHFSVSQSGKFTYAFSSGSIDLTQLSEDGQYRIELDAVFSGVNVYVKPGMSVAVQGSSAFGKVQLPNGNATFFGEISQGSTSGVTLVANAVFGSINIYEKS